MTLSQLLGATADELEAMTDEQLLAYFPKDIFQIVRPEYNKPVTPTKIDRTTVHRRLPSQKESFNEKMLKAQRMAEQLGIKL